MSFQPTHRCFLQMRSRILPLLECTILSHLRFSPHPTVAQLNHGLVIQSSSNIRRVNQSWLREDSFYVIISSFLQAYASVCCPRWGSAPLGAARDRPGIFGPAEGGFVWRYGTSRVSAVFSRPSSPRCKAPVWPSCPGLSSGVSPSSIATNCPLPSSSSFPLTPCCY